MILTKKRRKKRTKNKDGEGEDEEEKEEGEDKEGKEGENKEEKTRKHKKMMKTWIVCSQLNYIYDEIDRIPLDPSKTENYYGFLLLNVDLYNCSDNTDYDNKKLRCVGQ